MFTPIELAEYCAMIANGGTRYKTHFLNKVTDYDLSLIHICRQPLMLTRNCPLANSPKGCLNCKHAGKIRDRKGVDEGKIRRMAPLNDGYVRMANLAVYATHSTNGVSALHSEILKTRLPSP